MQDIARGQQPPEGGRHVLLVEDDEILAEVVTEVLDSLADVSWAGSAEAALELLPERRWDLMVADIELPGERDRVGRARASSRSQCLDPDGFRPLQL